MKISVSCECSYKKELPVSLDIIKDCAAKFLSFVIENSYVGSFSSANDYTYDLLLCDNDFIHNINRDYRKIDAPTDVITFALYNDSEEKIIFENTINLGQIVISVDKANAQALENNVPIEYEFLNLLAHGVLHLLGIDHPDENQLEKMLILQNKMIESTNYVKI